jgi:uncharacterized protein
MNMLITAGIIAFISEFFDSSLGMGYGTALAPSLILMGYPALNVVPAILISQLVADIASCVFHHQLRNVDFSLRSKHLKIAMVLGFISSLGVVVSVAIALHVPRWLLTLYIGLLVLCMGILILVSNRKTMNFSWPKILGIGFLAAFNKGISGGGYGPLVMGGQMLSGVCSKNAIGITAFAEAITCLIGFMTYLTLGIKIDWALTGWLIACATIAVPAAALTVKNMQSSTLKKAAGILILILGLCTLLKIGSA